MRAGSRHSKRMGLSALAAVAAVGALAAPAFASSVVPTPSDDTNLKCSDFQLQSFKPTPETAPGGNYAVNGGIISISSNGQGISSWSSTFGIDKVLVKGGPVFNVYTYDPPLEATSDSDLVTRTNPSNGELYGLSHVEFCYDGEQPPPKGPTVSKTAVPSFDRDFDWTIAKSVTSAPKVTTGDNTASFSYKVDVAKSAPVDSNFKVTGAIVINNPGGEQSFQVTDAIVGGPTCSVSGLTEGSVLVPEWGSVVLPYECVLLAATNGINRVDIEWLGGEFSDFDEVPFTFGAPSKVTDNSVDVTDAFNGGLPVLLAGGDDITAPQSFTYDRPVTVPTSGCTVFPNIANITSPDGLNESANASVEACRTVITTTTTTPPPAPAPAAAILGATVTPKAALRVTKTGPRAATAGQIVTYTITVKNTGKANARSVVLRDLLPSGYSLAGKANGATFRAGTLSWKFGTLAPGKSKTVKAKFRIDRSIGGRRCNTATAAASGVATVRDTACTRIAAVAGAVQPAVTG
jgi:uncharacterized repeat protein (TIGR01451 family)